MNFVTFNTIAGAKLHSDRIKDSDYGTRGEPYNFQATPMFRHKLDQCFEELWRVCPFGKANIVTTAGLWIDKPGMHQQGRAIDLDGLFWNAPRVQFVTLHDGYEGRNRKLYLGIEAILRKHFGRVIDYSYHDNAHRDHFHIDDSCEVGFDPSSEATVEFLQLTLKEVFDEPGVGTVDGCYGPKTKAAIHRVLHHLGITGNLALQAVWLQFLTRSAQTAFATMKSWMAATQFTTSPAPDSGLDWQSVYTGIEREDYVIPHQGLQNPTLESVCQQLTESYGTIENYHGYPFIRGKVSWFGGAEDMGVKEEETGALTGERLRKLGKDDRYCAMRWNYFGQDGRKNKAFWRDRPILVVNPTNDRAVIVRAIDWGPHIKTGRILDLSPGAMKDLGIKTDDEVLCAFARAKTDPAIEFPKLRQIEGEQKLSSISDETCIRELQQALNAIGFDCGKADGILGTKTEAAFARFKHTLDLGGTISPLAIDALIDRVNQKQTPFVATSSPHLLTLRGSVGRDGRNAREDVKTVQYLLNCNRHLLTPREHLAETGICNGETIAAIESFQARVVLLALPDGRIDPGGATLAKQKANARDRAIAPHFLFPFEQPPLKDYREGMR
ncbi:MAG: peptidoglycan-binding protein, partial [Spirulina sp.]